MLQTDRLLVNLPVVGILSGDVGPWGSLFFKLIVFFIMVYYLEQI